MNRAAFIFLLGTAYAAALGWAWQNSTLSGLAGSSSPGDAIASVSHVYTGNLNTACQTSLSDWLNFTVRSRVAYEYPTGRAYAYRAEGALAHYATLGCPKGSFLVAGRLAGEISRTLREQSGLARADLTHRIW